jgi:hypothetical protein
MTKCYGASYHYLVEEILSESIVELLHLQKSVKIRRHEIRHEIALIS